MRLWLRYVITAVLLAIPEAYIFTMLCLTWGTPYTLLGVIALVMQVAFMRRYLQIEFGQAKPYLSVEERERLVAEVFAKVTTESGNKNLPDGKASKS
ncbi:hypothetical protein [Pyrococcus kukulkanii]|uniref:Uncharacterized protein n=1 Tax=Pyrococcus kukulkanii TaxID=1609559 RepID=A0ABV4T9C1_9EURY